MIPVAVVGGGTMGNGIAQVFASKGHTVTLVEVDDKALGSALQTIEKSLDRLVRKEKIGDTDKQATLGNIKGVTSLACAGQPGLVVEAVVEDFEVKKRIFQELDSTCSQETILATNTSSISITELSAVTSRPDRFIGMHFMNPAPLMPLVEVIRGLATSDATSIHVQDWARALGKTPVEAQDYPGFISNRVLMPMINEAIFCLMEGVGTRDAIDQVMKLGMNHPLGPLQLADLIGLDVCLDILNVLYEGFSDSKYRPCPLLKKMVAAGHLGRKTGHGFYDYD